MRRYGHLFEEVAHFPNLLAAANRAARGKRNAASVAAVLERLEWVALDLERTLIAGAWVPSPVHRFEILDPKPRTITVTPFVDQIVHHSLIGVLEPLFERRMIDDSFACRKGKGAHRALARARQFVRRHAFFLKLDVKSFFASVRHDVALAALRRIVKDEHVLRLTTAILCGAPSQPSPSIGLPLGTLVSQWLANLVLDRLDHYVKETLRIPGYVRYMDDFVLFSDSRATLQDAKLHVAHFLDEELHLGLKERATMLAPAEHGLPFLGWIVHRGMLRVRPENLRRYRWRWRLRRYEMERGRRSEASYRQCVASLFALLGHGNTHSLRRSWIESHRLEL